jgi:transketolase
MDLRKPFWNTMCELAENDKSIRVLTGDLGFSFLEEFKEKYPDQFINCGIAEQSMVGIASGMALAGLKPYVYSGSIFLLARAYEQVRDDVAYNGTNVHLIGTGASQFLGFSHNWTGTENENDLLKNLPLKQFYPKNEVELKEALLVSGPAYIRL